MTQTFNSRFPGQYYIPFLGINYNYFRDYEPGTGRYVESDPLGLGGGINTYAYTGDSPLGAIDPKGKLSFGPSCNYIQRAKLMTALLDLWKDLFKNACMGCNGQHCMSCEEAQRIIGWLLSSANISCDGVDDYIGGKLIVACGDVPHQTDLQGNITSGLDYIQFAGPYVSSGWPPCGCLKSTLLHEGIHHDHVTNGGYSNSNEENNTKRETKKCISCARSDF